MSKSLNICLVTPYYYPNIGGIAKYTHQLAKLLTQYGQHVTVITGNDLDGNNISTTFDEDIRLIRLPAKFDNVQKSINFITGMPYLSWSINIHRVLHELSNKNQFDVVEFTNWRSLGLIHSFHKVAPQVMRLLTGISQISPSTVQFQSLNLSQNVQVISEYAKVKLLSFQEKIATIKSDYVICPTHHHLLSYAASTGLNTNQLANVAYIPFGVSYAEDGDKRNTSVLKEKFRILYVGRLSYRKGFDTFMQALPFIFRKSKMEIECVIVGEDTYDSDGQSMWQKFRKFLNPSDLTHVHYLGNIDDAELENIYQTSNLLLAPSRYESFGLVFIEAMRQGLPTVACRIGGAIEIIEEGQTGFLVEPGDPIQLAEAALNLVNNQNLCKAFGQKAKDVVKAKYNLKQMVLATLEVYKKIACH